MRLFLAIDLTHEGRRDLGDAAAPLRASAPGLGWVAESRLHLTMKFLGEQPGERLPDIERATAAVGARHRELSVAIGGVGAFPNFRRPRVVWIAVDQEPRFELLHHDLEVAFDAIGFEIDGRPFRPHITLGRVRNEMHDDERRALARAARQIDYEGELAVRSIDVMRSDPGASAAYTLVHAAPLRSE